MGIALVVLLVVVAFVIGLAINAASADKPLTLRPYYSKKPLTSTEALFYQRLVEALPDCIVLAQVQLSRFINVDGMKAGAHYQRYFNAISQQSVDYLVCLKDFTIVAAIELDDKSHNTAAAQQRDEKKTRNLNAAEVPLIRWHAETMPSVEDIRVAFTQDIEDAVAKPVELQWQSEDQEAYFRRHQRASNWAAKWVAKLLAPIAMKLIAGIAVAIAALMAFNFLQQGLTHGIQNLATLPQQMVAPSLKHIEEQQIKLQQASLERVRQQQQLEALQKREAFAAQQARKQQEIEAMQLAAAKEQAWEAFYRKSLECRTEGNLITCGNEYAKARREFEMQWQKTPRP